MSASGDMHRLVNLATLSDSLDYLADAIQHFGDSQQPRQSASVSLTLSLLISLLSNLATTKFAT